MDYSELTLHLALLDIFNEDEEVLYGFAIKTGDETSFLIDLEKLVKRYGGAPFDELLMQDDSDESAMAAIKYRKGMSKTRLRDAIIDVTPVDSGRMRE